MATSTFLKSLLILFHYDLCCDCAEKGIHRELKTNDDAANHIVKDRAMLLQLYSFQTSAVAILPLVQLFRNYPDYVFPRMIAFSSESGT